MSDTIAYQQVRRIRIAPDGVRVILKDGSVRLFQAEELEFEMPNGNIVDVDQLIEAINLKGYVSKPSGKPVKDAEQRHISEYLEEAKRDYQAAHVRRYPRR